MPTLEQERITKPGQVDFQMRFEIVQERLPMRKYRSQQQPLQTSKRRQERGDGERQEDGHGFFGASSFHETLTKAEQIPS